MITCERCGTKNNDTFNCCYNCGARLKKQAENPIIIGVKQASDFNDEEIDKVENTEETNEIEESEVSEETAEDGIDESFYADLLKDMDADEDNKTSAPKSRQQQKKKRKGGVPIKRVLFILVVLLVAFFAVWGTIKLLDKLFPIDDPIGGPTKEPEQTYSPSSPDPTDGPTIAPIEYDDPWFEGNYIPATTVDGDSLYNISIQTNAESISALGKTYTVENGRVDFVATQYEIYTWYKPSSSIMGDKFDANLEIVAVSSKFAEDYVYTIKIVDITTPVVPITMISPSSEYIATVYKTKTTISFKTTALNARIFINDVECTDDYFDNKTGIFSMDILTPVQDDSYLINVRVESPDYLVKKFDLELTRSTEHDPNAEVILELNNDARVFVTDEATGYVSICGKFTGKKDKLLFNARNNKNFNLVSLTFDDDGEGYFEAIFTTNKQLWTEVTIECTYDASIMTTILVEDFSNGRSSITTSAQSLEKNYATLASYNYTSGGGKLVIGYSTISIVKEIFDTELGKAAWVNVTPEEETEKLVYVEFGDLDTGNIQAGTSIKLFGISLRAKDGCPRIAAVYWTIRGQTQQ